MFGNPAAPACPLVSNWVVPTQLPGRNEGRKVGARGEMSAGGGKNSRWDLPEAVTTWVSTGSCDRSQGIGCAWITCICAWIKRCVERTEREENRDE